MDIISFNEASTANGRIENFIENPDSSSGVLTVPKTIAAGETITIPAGRVAILPDLQVDGDLVVDGDLFIPTGSMTSQVVQKVTSTDNAVVRFDGTTGQVQNSAITIDDSGNVGSGTQSFNGFGGSGFKNYLYNPKFDVAQRGTVFANTTATGKQYTLDRWSTYFYNLNNTRFINTTTGEVSNNAIKFGRFDNKTDTYPSWLAQELEIKDSIPLRGKTITVSFWAKKGAGLSGNFVISTNTGTVGDESWVNGYTGKVEDTRLVPITTSLTKYTYTFTLNSNIKQLALIFALQSHSVSATTNDWVWIEKVQLEEGSVATPFENRPYGLELSLCQRYCFNPKYEADGSNQVVRGDCYGVDNINGWINFKFPVPMRIMPSLYLSSGFSQLYLGYPDAMQLTALSQKIVSCNEAVFAYSVASGNTANRHYHLYIPDSANKILFTAEL